MSFTLTSPFASISGEAIESLAECGDSAANPDVSSDEVILDEFAGESSSYELEDLDPLSALEKYCRSDMPAQRLAYTAGIGAAVGDLEPSAVSGSLVSLLRELLGDVYADVRLTALQQVVPVARRLRDPGMTYQSDIENLWDIVQPVMLDADVENQEAAAQVLAELTHLVAWGNSVVAGQKLVWAVQRLQRLPQELLAEGALAALRLITEVVVPRPGCSLCFDAIQDFAVSIFKDMASYERSADVRQAVALLLPRFVRHMPAAVRATLLPGLLKTLASDTHWNVRAEVPSLLINLLAGTQHTVGHTSSQTHSSSSSKHLGEMFDRTGGDSYEQQEQQPAGDGSSHTAAAVGSANAAVGAAAVEGFTPEERRVICEAADKLCRDACLLVKVPAQASLGQLLPLLPAADAAASKPNLLGLYAATARPPASMGGTRVPAPVCAPRLSGKAAVQRQRRQQQRRSGKAAHQQQRQRQDASAVNGNNSHVANSNKNSSLETGAGKTAASSSPFADAAGVDPPSSCNDGITGEDFAGSAKSQTDTAAETAAEVAPVPDAVVADMACVAGIDPSLLKDDEFHDETSDDPAAVAAASLAEAEAASAAAATREQNIQDRIAAAARHEPTLDPAIAAVAHVAGAAGVDAHLLDRDLSGESDTVDAGKFLIAAALAAEAADAIAEQQQQGSKIPAVHVAARGTAAAELPLTCAFHLGKVTRHVGSHCWPIVQPAFLSLAAAALAGDADIAAALLLSFPDLAASLGQASTRAVLVPVILELLHNQLEQLAPVLSVMLYDVTAALPADLRICLLQLLPSLAIQPDREVAGDWRARAAVAQQLPALAQVLTSPQVAYCVWPLLLTLAKDPVHAVRSAAAVQVGPLLMQLPDHEVPPAESAATDAAAAAAADAAEESAASAAAATPQEAASGSDLPASDSAVLADDITETTVIGKAAMPTATAVADADLPAAAAAAVSAASAGHDEQLLAAAQQQLEAQLLEQQQESGPSTAAASEGQQTAAEQQQQPSQQPHRSRLGKMKHGLLHGLQHLHQQLQDGIQQGVDLVKDSGGLQRALTEVDSQLHWLQQHPTGSVLHSIGQKISAAAAAGGSSLSNSNSNAYFSLGPLEGQLNSLDVLESVVDPCKYLPTPAWPALAVDLAALAKGGTSTERQAFVIAAGSILAAHQQRAQQQQHWQTTCDAAEDNSMGSSATTDPALYEAQAGVIEQQQQQELQTMELDHLLQELYQLAGDPVPGVRCGVASVAGKLLRVSEAAAAGSSSSSTINACAKVSTTSSTNATVSTGDEEPSSAAVGVCNESSPLDNTVNEARAAAHVPNITAGTMHMGAGTGSSGDAGAAAEGKDENRTQVATDAAAAGIPDSTVVPAAQGGDAEPMAVQMAAAADALDNSSDAAALAKQDTSSAAAASELARDKLHESTLANTDNVESKSLPAIPDAAADVATVGSSCPASGAAAAVGPASASTADVPGLPAGAGVVLQQCLQKLQQDPCVSVASVAGEQHVGAGVTVRVPAV